MFRAFTRCGLTCRNLSPVKVLIGAEAPAARQAARRSAGCVGKIVFQKVHMRRLQDNSPGRASAWSGILRLAMVVLAGLAATTGWAQPTNDNFGNAAAISGLTGTIKGSNVGATKEAGEPSHAGNTGGASIWYR